MIGSATSRTSRPESEPKPPTKIPDSSSGATTGSPSERPSWKSSAPQPGATWTIPVPSSSPTSVQATILIALVHLRLRDAGPAAGAPGHRVVALVDPAPPVALGQEAPDQVVVLVAEREVAAARVGHPEPSDE